MELVVAGGDTYGDVLDTTEIFNFETLYWRDGPRLARPIYDAETVQVTEMEFAFEAMHLNRNVQMSKTFLIMGGMTDGDPYFLDTIYQFDSVNRWWILRKERLEIPRKTFAAIPLPDGWDAC